MSWTHLIKKMLYRRAVTRNYILGFVTVDVDAKVKRPSAVRCQEDPRYTLPGWTKPFVSPRISGLMPSKRSDWEVWDSSAGESGIGGKPLTVLLGCSHIVTAYNPHGTLIYMPISSDDNVFAASSNLGTTI
ncbi:hypothetical protein EI94DRAFT_1709257 [Lactarius quietus]|nr:hypothetical protein EI94DRAFT_1709257 [Lactarius quietus]